MKKTIFIILLIMAIPLLAFGQSGIHHRGIATGLLEGSDTVTVWEPFMSTRYETPLSLTQVDPSDMGGFLGNLTSYIYVDSVGVTASAFDSLLWMIQRTDHLGDPIGEASYVTFGTSGESGSLGTTAVWNAFTPSNRFTTDVELMWIDLRGEFEDWLGIKHTFVKRDFGVGDSTRVNYHSNQMR